MYWRRHPPTHVLLGALLRGLGGAAPADRAASAPVPSSAAAEAIAAELGPPLEKFQPACRILQTSAPPPGGGGGDP